MTLADDVRRARERREVILALPRIRIEGVLHLWEDPGLLLTPEEDAEAMGGAEDEAP